jgi:hypothetical protein
MSESPYTRFQAEELILRDELAIDRTLLAYLRSGWPCSSPPATAPCTAPSPT